MDEERLKKLKEALHKINSDSSLTEQEKAKLRQELFSQPSTQKPETPKDDSLGPSFHDSAKQIFGCSHYQRDAKIVAKCCDKVFTCRFCHDEASDHKIVRFEIEEMVCMHCRTRQPIQQLCHSSVCGERKLASYYCAICKFFDNSGRAIYHCPGCGICRVGKGIGIDFFHCNGCNLCFPLSGEHQCPKVDVRERNCPVCLEDLFHSRDRVHPLRCSHHMHTKCYEEHRRSSALAICPICSKSLDPPPTIQRSTNTTTANTRTEARVSDPQTNQNDQMEGTTQDSPASERAATGRSEESGVTQAENQDQGQQTRANNVTRIVLPSREMTPEYLEMFLARSLPMPQEYRHIQAKVLCNDCLEHTTTSYHFYGSWCGHCGSWNTRLVSTDPSLASLSAPSPNSTPAGQETSGGSPSPNPENVSNNENNNSDQTRPNQPPPAENNVIQLIFSDQDSDRELHLEIAYENATDSQLEHLPSVSVAQLVEGYLGSRHPNQLDSDGEVEEEEEEEEEDGEDDEDIIGAQDTDTISEDEGEETEGQNNRVGG